MMRWAVLRPSPDTAISAPTSSAAMAARIWSAVNVASMVMANRGPIPDTVCTVWNTSRSPASANPYSVRLSSRTTSAVVSRNSCPTSADAAVRGVTST